MELQPETLIHGRADGGAVDYYRFHAEKDETVVVECLAQQLDSSLLPVLTIWDANGRQLSRSRRLNDPILVWTSPESSDYLLGVHDHIYGGGASHAYALQLHTGPYLVSVAPHVALPGTSSVFTVIGRNLPGGTPTTDLHLDNAPLEQVQVRIFVPPAATDPTPAIVDPVAADAEGFSFRWSTPAGNSNPVVIGMATQPVVVEAEPNNLPEQAQRVDAPCEVSGRFYPRRDQDWVQFSATKGQQFQILVISHRGGHPTDPEIFVQRVLKTSDGQEQTSQIATDDDFRADGKRYRQGLRRGLELDHRDPTARFTADQDADYRVGLRDLNGSSIDDPRLTYRLVVEPVEPDFELLAWTQVPAADDDKKIERGGMVIRSGERLPILVDLFREGGFEGPVELTAHGLPAGVEAPPCYVPAGATQAVLVLSAATELDSWCGPIEITGTASIENVPRVRRAREAVLTSATGNVEQSRPTARLARQMMLAVVANETASADIALTAEGSPSVFETSRGGKISIPLRMVAHGELKSELALAPLEVPDKVKIQGVTLKSDATEGQLEVVLDSPEIKPGRYSVILRGKLKTSYGRNPDAIAALEAARGQFDATTEQIAQQLAAAAQAVAAAKQSAIEKTEQFAQLQTTQDGVVQAFQAASAQLSQASQQLAGLMQSTTSTQAAQAGEIQELLDQATLAAGKAGEQLQTVQTSLAQVRDQWAQTQSQIETLKAEQAKVEAEQQALEQKKQRADAYRQELDKRLEEARKNLGPKDIDTYINSPAITLEIHSSPVTINVPDEMVTLKRGETAPVTLDVTRRFGFSDAVTLTLDVPQGVAELGAETQTVGPEATSASLQLKAGGNASLGQHRVNLNVALKFNGVDITEKVPLVVQISE